MASTPMGTQSFDIGRVISRGFGAFSRNIPLFMGLAVVLSAIPTFLLTSAIGMLGLSGGAAALATGTVSPMAVILGAIAAVLVTVLASSILQAAIIRGTISDLNGKASSFGDCISTALASIVPIIGIALVSGLGIGIGMLFLIVPGIILSLMWAVAVPVRIEEGTGIIESLSRSNALTSGSKGNIFLLYLVIGIIGAIVGFVAGLIAAPFGSMIAGLVTALVGSVSAAIGAAIVASIYVELRSVKEGASVESMASVFS